MNQKHNTLASGDPLRHPEHRLLRLLGLGEHHSLLSDEWSITALRAIRLGLFASATHYGGTKCNADVLDSAASVRAVR